jgi:hypothetical protein
VTMGLREQGQSNNPSPLMASSTGVPIAVICKFSGNPVRHRVQQRVIGGQIVEVIVIGPRS